MSVWDYVKCDKLRVKCGYRLPDGECAPKGAYALFECFEKEPPKKKGKTE
jgi:hypothetical protein